MGCGRSRTDGPVPAQAVVVLGPEATPRSAEEAAPDLLVRFSRGIGFGMSLNEASLEIEGIIQGSQAAAAGVTLGMTVLEVEGEPIADPNEFVSKVAAVEGEFVNIKFKRRTSPDQGIQSAVSVDDITVGGSDGGVAEDGGVQFAADDIAMAMALSQQDAEVLAAANAPLASASS